MAQFPFAHTIEMTHRLSGGVLEVRTTIENHSTDPMPLVIGFHPWYQIPETPRDRWKVHACPCESTTCFRRKLIPTGETKPVDLPDPTPLAGRQLDDVFGGVDRQRRVFARSRRPKSVRPVRPEISNRDRLRARKRATWCASSR